jgi:ADP-ribose pyrophosphatase
VREIVRPPDAVAVVPIDSYGMVHLVRQSRPAVGDVLLEIPAGLIDAGETPEETAERELIEEIGRRPLKLIPLVSYYHAEGYSTGRIWLFLAHGLEQVPDFIPNPNEILEQVNLPFADAIRMVENGEFQDSKSMLGIKFAEKYL